MNVPFGQIASRPWPKHGLAMEYRYLGRSGLKVSTLSFGSWVTFGDQMGEEPARDCMIAAYEAGVTFFDNAESYAGGRSEELMGRVLKQVGWKRSDLVLSTKVFWGGRGPNDKGLSRKHVIEGLHASLKRMQLEYFDILFCHRPDLHTPIEETVWAMNILLQKGLIFYWGTSEWTAEQIMQAHLVARRDHLIPPLCEQPQYHMLHRERVEVEYSRLYDEVGLGTTIWSPLASGLLTGKYNNGLPQGTRATLPGYEWLQKSLSGDQARQSIEKVKRLEPIARELGASLAQLAIAWCAKNPRVSTVITGASRAEQVRENMRALDVMNKLTPEVMGRIEEVLANRPEPLPDLR
jgi:voltage-dependent potassium channel beta subunit